MKHCQSHRWDAIIINSDLRKLDHACTQRILSQLRFHSIAPSHQARLRFESPVILRQPTSPQCMTSHWSSITIPSPDWSSMLTQGNSHMARSILHTAGGAEPGDYRDVTATGMRARCNLMRPIPQLLWVILNATAPFGHLLRMPPQ